MCNVVASFVQSDFSEDEQYGSYSVVGSFPREYGLVDTLAAIAYVDVITKSDDWGEGPLWRLIN